MPEGNCVLGQDVPSGECNKEDKAKDPPSQTKNQDMSAPEPLATMPNVEQPALYRREYFQRVTCRGPASELSFDTYWRHIQRPFVILFRIPAVTFVAIQYSIMLCWVAVLATTQPILFAAPPYNFSSIGVGNINVAPFLGAVLGSIYGGPLNDLYVVKLARRRSGLYDPETRLHMIFAPLILTPLGLFLYGISMAEVGRLIIQIAANVNES